LIELLLGSEARANVETPLQRPVNQSRDKASN
jgi:hypothetical protein